MSDDEEEDLGKKEEEKKVKRMADLFRSGATMMAESCPECHSPLFSLRGQIYCASCDRNVIILKPSESEADFYVREEYEEMGAQIEAKIREMIFAISEEKDPKVLTNRFSCLKTAIECLEKLRSLRKKS